MDAQPPVGSVPAVASVPPTPGEILERSLPEPQRWINRFCENWIFAFIVAMAIRHFGLEAFRIPTASMEPMLYGDPAFTQSDHVIVDKLVSRFRTPQRWDVTVFQFPQPEIMVGGRETTAIDDRGERRDSFLTNPLVYRNFVKRAVVLPGERFYIANGDLFIARADQAFTIERKPEKIQEALWQDVYRHRAGTNYRPWENGRGTGFAPQEGSLGFQLASGGAVTFTQPLRNLYVKPGPVLASRKGRDGEKQQVEVSMLDPEFTLKDGTKGNLWDLDEWQFMRLTSADLDNWIHAKELNASMDEHIGDVRVRFVVDRLDGWVVLRLAAGEAQRIDLRLAATGWQLDVDRAVVGEGSGSPIGKAVSLATIDDQAVATIAGVEVARVDLAAIDPQLHQAAISWYGDGAITCADLTVQRDVHYCANGFLEPLEDAKHAAATYKATINASTNRESLISSAKALRDMSEVRATVRAKPVGELTPSEKIQPWGFSAETAATAPADGYLMLGDNSPFSWDGRNWGFVPAINLRGRVLAVVLWPSRWHVVR